MDQVVTVGYRWLSWLLPFGPYTLDEASLLDHMCLLSRGAHLALG
jgi:hypothetical protein